MDMIKIGQLYTFVLFVLLNVSLVKGKCQVVNDSSSVYRQLLLSLDNVAVINSSESIETRIRLGDWLIRNDSLVQAEEMLIESLTLANRASPQYDKLIPWINVRLVKVYRRLEQFDVAKQILLGILQGGISERERSCLFTASALQELGLLLYHGVQIDESDIDPKQSDQGDILASESAVEVAVENGSLVSDQRSSSGDNGDTTTALHDESAVPQNDQTNRHHAVDFSISLRYNETTGILRRSFEVYRRCGLLEHADLWNIATAFDDLLTADSYYRSYAVEMYDSLLSRVNRLYDAGDSIVRGIQLRLAACLEKDSEKPRAIDLYKLIIKSTSSNSRSGKVEILGYTAKVAELLKDIGEYDKALDLAHENLSSTLSVFDRRSDEVISSYDLLCRIAIDADSSNLAERMRTIQLGIIDSTHGPTSPQAIVSLTKLAQAVWYQERYADANRIISPRLRKAQVARIRHAVPEARLRAELAYIRYKLKMFQSADSLIQMAIDTLFYVDEPDESYFIHLIVAGWIKEELNEDQDAIYLYERADRFIVNTKNDDSKRRLRCKVALARLYEEREDYERAIGALETIVRIVRNSGSSMDTALYVKSSIKYYQLQLLYGRSYDIDDDYIYLDMMMQDYANANDEARYEMRQLRVLKAVTDGDFVSADSLVGQIITKYRWEGTLGLQRKVKLLSNRALYLCLAGRPDNVPAYLAEADRLLNGLPKDINLNEVRWTIARAKGDYYRLTQRYDSSVYWYDTSNDLAEGGAIDRLQSDMGKASTLFLMGRFHEANQLFNDWSSSMSAYRDAINYTPYVRYHARSLAKAGGHDESLRLYSALFRATREKYGEYSSQSVELLEEIVPVIGRSSQSKDVERIQQYLNRLRQGSRQGSQYKE